MLYVQTTLFVSGAALVILLVLWIQGRLNHLACATVLLIAGGVLIFGTLLGKPDGRPDLGWQEAIVFALPAVMVVLALSLVCRELVLIRWIKSEGGEAGG